MGEQKTTLNTTLIKKRWMKMFVEVTETLSTCRVDVRLFENVHGPWVVIRKNSWPCQESSPQTKSSPAKTQQAWKLHLPPALFNIAVHYFSHRWKKLFTKYWVLLALVLAVYMEMFLQDCVSSDRRYKLKKRQRRKISLAYCLRLS